MTQARRRTQPAENKRRHQLGCIARKAHRKRSGRFSGTDSNWGQARSNCPRRSCTRTGVICSPGERERDSAAWVLSLVVSSAGYGEGPIAGRCRGGELLCGTLPVAIGIMPSQRRGQPRRDIVMDKQIASDHRRGPATSQALLQFCHQLAPGSQVQHSLFGKLFCLLFQHPGRTSILQLWGMTSWSASSLFAIRTPSQFAHVEIHWSEVVVIFISNSSFNTRRRGSRLRSAACAVRSWSVAPSLVGSGTAARVVVQWSRSVGSHDG